MKGITENFYWQCPKCNEINESGFEMCWNCQYEKTEKDEVLSNNQISEELIQERRVKKRSLPKSPPSLNILGALMIIGYLINIFSINYYDSIFIIISVIISSLSLVGFVAILWMRKWGVTLYLIIYLINFFYIFYLNNVADIGEMPNLYVYQIIPTIIIIWCIQNYNKMK